MTSRQFLRLLLAAIASTTFSHAFVAPNHRHAGVRRQAPPLHMVTEINDKPKDWRTLPNRDGLSSDTTTPKEEMVGAEIYIGRIAMLGFVGLVVGEVLTGESFSQQFLEAGLFLIGAT